MSARSEKFSLAGLVFYFLKLGTIGFGGPIALIGYMQKDLVEEKGWISQDEYRQGLTLSQLSPGPLATQLAIYFGYIRGKILGATLIGAAFILPSFLMVILLGMLYQKYGGLPWIQALFYGISAAVIGIIAKSAYKLTQVTIKRNATLWIIFIVMAVVTVYTKQEIVWLFIVCGVVALLFALSTSRLNLLVPPFFVSAFIPALKSSALMEIFLFFTKAGAFVFGSGLAIVPFLYGGVVEQHHWLNHRQFLDAVAVAMITPGPIVITAGFIGYLVAGVWGAVLAAAGVFLPPYLIIILFTPLFQRYGKNPNVAAFVDGVTAAAIGAITGAAIILGQQAIIDIPTAVIAAATLFVLFRWKIQEPYLVAGGGLLGLLFFHPH